MALPRLLIGLLSALLVSASLDAQSLSDSARVVQILRVRDSVANQSKTFHLGLSVGWRHIVTQSSAIYRDAVIDPTTNRVAVDSIDRDDVVLSGTLTGYPFHVTPNSNAPWWSHLGFIANVNIAAFNSDNLGVFNKSIEGGGGLAWRFANDFGIGLTIERVFGRRLRSFIQPGQLVIVQGDTLTSLSRDDGRFFRDDNLTALSLKFLYSIK